jgi:glycerol-3-phosphate dehydrogenase
LPHNMNETSIVGSGNLSTSLSNVARLAAHPKFVWVFNAKAMGQSFIMTL